MAKGAVDVARGGASEENIWQPLLGTTQVQKGRGTGQSGRNRGLYE